MNGRFLAACVPLVCTLQAGQAMPAAPETPLIDAAVRIDPAMHTLAGKAAVTIPPGPAHRLVLGARFREAIVTSDSEVRRVAAEDDAGAVAWSVPASTRATRLVIRWHGTLAPLDPDLDHRQTLTATDPVSSQEGTFLPAASHWYPGLEDERFRYRVTIDLPGGQAGLVPGDLVEESRRADGFRATYAYEHPADGIDLMAGPYLVDERMVRSIDGRGLRLRTYFPADLRPLAADYLDSVSAYIGMYEKWIGPYPYAGFSVVASPTPTGFGMPTLTYLGAQVLRLPFIRATSLGHEVLHDWWGNGVFPDYRHGNWSEGLTTFMADYHYRERQGAAAARDTRLAWLRDVSAVPPDRMQPLVTFTSRTHAASQILGYQQTAMVFEMLRNRIGEHAFDEAVRAFWKRYRFRVASWDDLRETMEAASGEDLRDFFREWLDRPGVPEIRLSEAEVRAAPGGWHIDVALTQSSPAHDVKVPLRVVTNDGEQSLTVRLDQPAQRFRLAVPSRPERVELDPDMRVLRRLTPGEAPPIFRDIMVEPHVTLRILSGDDAFAAAAQSLASRLLDSPPDGPGERGGPLAAPALVVGSRADVQRFLARENLPPVPAPVSERPPASAWTLGTPRGLVAFVTAEDADALRQVARLLPHYGRQSWVVFDRRHATARGSWPAVPQSVEVASTPAAPP
ncbi:MAG: M1 family peptidase [Betaproteobacteria bacterium]|nr:M1 family peptidase [Betaproteobacteria bacterium]